MSPRTSALRCALQRAGCRVRASKAALYVGEGPWVEVMPRGELMQVIPSGGARRCVLSVSPRAVVDQVRVWLGGEA